MFTTTKCTLVGFLSVLVVFASDSNNKLAKIDHIGAPVYDSDDRRLKNLYIHNIHNFSGAIGWKSYITYQSNNKFLYIITDNKDDTPLVWFNDRMCAIYDSVSLSIYVCKFDRMSLLINTRGEHIDDMLLEFPKGQTKISDKFDIVKNANNSRILFDMNSIISDAEDPTFAVDTRTGVVSGNAKAKTGRAVIAYEFHKDHFRDSAISKLIIKPVMGDGETVFYAEANSRRRKFVFDLPKDGQLDSLGAKIITVTKAEEFAANFSNMMYKSIASRDTIRHTNVRNLEIDGVNETELSSIIKKNAEISKNLRILFKGYIISRVEE